MQAFLFGFISLLFSAPTLYAFHMSSSSFAFLLRAECYTADFSLAPDVSSPILHEVGTDRLEKPYVSASSTCCEFLNGQSLVQTLAFCFR